MTGGGLVSRQAVFSWLWTMHLISASKRTTLGDWRKRRSRTIWKKCSAAWRETLTKPPRIPTLVRPRCVPPSRDPRNSSRARGEVTAGVGLVLLVDNRSQYLERRRRNDMYARIAYPAKKPMTRPKQVELRTSEISGFPMVTRELISQPDEEAVV
jgi:hypothetical protein